MSTPAPYSRAADLALPFGLVYAVHLPDSADPVPEEILKRLHPDERTYAKTLRGYKQVSWVGGRLAMRKAMRSLLSNTPPILTGPFGEPILPPGISASISHKRTLAVAMVARSAHGRLGIDLEEPDLSRGGIGPRVLRPEEVREVEALQEDRQWTAILLRFSIKEAIFKAIFPHVQRYVGFEEALVRPCLDGFAQVELFLKGEEGPFLLEARYHWLGTRLLSAVRLRPTPASQEE